MYPYDYDYATIKYSSAGVPLWTNRYNGPGSGEDRPRAVAMDGDDNVIVTGVSDGGSATGWDYATIKYSSDGVPLWTNRYNGPGNGNDGATALVVDASNSVIVTGWSPGIGSDDDYATIKYSSTGVPLWTNRYNGPGNFYDAALAVALDGSNNVIVTGYSAGTKVAPYDYDYAIIKYSSAGLPLWTNRYNGPGKDTDIASAIAVDSRNHVIVTGRSVGVRSSADYATIEYSSAGVPLWTNRYNGAANGNDGPGSLVVDSRGAIIVTGSSAHLGGGYDVATIRYVSVPSPVITNLSRAGGKFQMQIDDVLEPGTLVIEASTNLAVWSPVFTNTSPTNALFYTDPNAGNYPRRFYRAFQFP